MENNYKKLEKLEEKLGEKINYKGIDGKSNPHLEKLRS